MGSEMCIRDRCGRPAVAQAEASSHGSHGESSSAGLPDEEAAYIAKHESVVNKAMNKALTEVIAAKSANPVAAIAQNLLGTTPTTAPAAREPALFVPQKSSGGLPSWYDPVRDGPAVAEAAPAAPPPKSMDDKIDELRGKFPGASTDYLKKLLNEYGGDVDACLAGGKSGGLREML